MVSNVPHGKETEAADDLAQLLTSGMFDQFLELFRRTALTMENGAVVLVDMVNERIHRQKPDSEAALIVSQAMEGKHLIVIQGGSRFFGDSCTITRNMFVV
jgi:hypothetical protein